jgi:hypothetical protein
VAPGSFHRRPWMIRYWYGTRALSISITNDLLADDAGGVCSLGLEYVCEHSARGSTKRISRSMVFALGACGDLGRTRGSMRVGLLQVQGLGFVRLMSAVVHGVSFGAGALA